MYLYEVERSVGDNSLQIHDINVNYFLSRCNITVFFLFLLRSKKRVDPNLDITNYSCIRSIRYG